MIQRIQSLLLLLVAGVCAAVIFLPLAGYTTIDGSDQIIMYMTGYEMSSSLSLPLPLPIWILLCNILLGGIAFVNIFFFKNRMLQLRLNRIAMFANIGLVVVFFLIAGKIEKMEEITSNITYGSGAYIVLVPIILIVIANIAIRNDEKKVRAADRLR